MWATILEIETFTEYYHTLKVSINISLNLVSTFLTPQNWIIVNDVLNILGYYQHILLMQKGETYIL